MTITKLSPGESAIIDNKAVVNLGTGVAFVGKDERIVGSFRDLAMRLSGNTNS